MRILNTSDEPVVLHKQKLLGFLYSPPHTRKLVNVKGVQKISSETPHEFGMAEKSVKLV